MGLFSKIKNGLSSKANAAIDKAISPEKELELVITQMEAGKKKALAEIVGLKATAKLCEQQIVEQKAKAAEWEKRAMLAVKMGNDEDAKACLRKKNEAEQQVLALTNDRDQALSLAIAHNQSRKEFETKLTSLKLRKSTVALGRTMAKTGESVLSTDNQAFEKLKKAEAAMDEAEAMAEAEAELALDNAKK